MLNDHYIEFSSTDVYKSMDVSPSGEDFFRESLINIERVIHPEDRAAFHSILDKPTMVQMLQGKHMISHTYRLLIGTEVMYARMSVIWATDNKHLIVGVMNIDQEIRRDQEIEKKLHMANEKAYRDGLTGVKNKVAFTEYEDSLQEQIRLGSVREFAVVVCDVNDLKTINDSLGHIEGDAHIKNATAMICHTWTHSPVFRIGGDEFAVVLQGEDYANRNILMDNFKARVLENRRSGGIVIAVGMSDYDPDADSRVAEVFDRADNMMYENKATLKGDWSSVR